ncbi:MAG TPA: DUF4974 domain-containing protein [Tenuifilaceae bacterium]|nr:DUF4974 domain-containing protein [Tenuifilaceae bacterium]
MSRENLNIDQIIVRFLANEASDQEVELLNSWMDQSEENRKYFGDIQFINSKTISSHRIIRVDVDNAWSKVQSQMKKSESKKEEPKGKIISFNIPTLAKVAAVILIATGVSFALFRYLFTPVIESTQVIALASNDSIVSKQLEDSSTVFLNRNSKITYSKAYGRKKREVKLEGEAFFDVKHVDEKPFIVEAEGTFIEDIGTSFNIKAFDSDTIVEVFVKTGEVMFFTKENEGISLKEGETGIYSKNSRTFKKKSQEEGNTISYVNRIFVFQNTRLSEAIQQLSNVYGVDIALQNDSLRDCTITVTFENEEINIVLSIIAETLNLQLREADNKFIIEGDSCSNTDQQ